MTRRNFLKLPGVVISSLLPAVLVQSWHDQPNEPDLPNFGDSDFAALAAAVSAHYNWLIAVSKRVRALEERVPGAHIFEQGEESNG
jgi:hypothetical protein